MSLARPEADPNVTPRKLLLLAVPAILVGVVCALILWTLDRAADALSNVIWTALPGALSVDPNGWWIILVLTVTGLAVGIALQVIPGHGGPDSATTELVGAPLLGAFSCAAGVAMWAQIFQPGRITGAPISWLLGGNPLLDSVWLFANGVICFQQGYKFFMIALRDEQTAQRVVRELRGLLPDAV